MTAVSPRALLQHWTRPDSWPLMAALGSAAILAGAFAFEILGNYPPCPLCIEQRWAHVYVMLAGLIAYAGLRFLKPASAWIDRAATGLIALLFGHSAWIAGYHAGGEYKLWPLNCQATDVSGVTVEDLLAALNTPTNVVLCDEPAWTLLGVSMAGYNTLFSAAMGIISLLIILRRPNRSL